MNPTISVIIPVFNGAAFIREAIESALAQTLPPTEIIVVDDGSTDGTGEVAQALPVTYFRQDNLGVSTARNLAISHSSGDYLAFLDSDDIWVPHKMARQFEEFERDSELGYVLCYIRYFSDPGHESPAWFRRNSPPEQDASYPPSTWIMKRQAWEKVGLFDPAKRVVEDIDWLARAHDLGVSFKMVEEPLVMKRLHENNLTGQVDAIKQGMVDALRASAARKRALRASD